MRCSPDQMLVFKWSPRIVSLILHHGLAPHKLTHSQGGLQWKVLHQWQLVGNEDSLEPVHNKSPENIECWSQNLRISCSAFWSYPSWPALPASVGRDWLRYPNLFSILISYSCTPSPMLNLPLLLFHWAHQIYDGTIFRVTISMPSGSVRPEVTFQPAPGSRINLLEYQSHNYIHPKQAMLTYVN